MIKGGWLLLVAALALSCAGMDAGRDNPLYADEPVAVQNQPMREQSENAHWVAGAQSGLLTIFGVSNPQLRRETEIENAMEDAARKAAMFQGIQGSVRTVNRTGSGFLDFTFDSSVDYTYDSNLEKYRDRLKYEPDKDIIRIDGAVFIKMQYEVPGQENISYVAAKITDGRPAWINSVDLPRFEGYTVVVGFARNQRWLKDTITKSSEDAVARLIERSSSQVTTNETSVSGYGSSSVIYTQSAGSLLHFRVLEFWIDPESRAVWTLAVAKIL